MTIVFDMDNTITDEVGSSVRPGMKELLDELVKQNHTLILWTNSTRERAKFILFEHRLRHYFSKFIFREDYDPRQSGIHKDIRKVNGDILIDDDPEEIKYMKTIKKKGFLITSFRKAGNPPDRELSELRKVLKTSRGLFS